LVVVEEVSKFDVIVVGGGPAGMSAALWCSDLGLSCILIEKDAEFGGQLQRIHNPITNYLGLPAKNGREMLERFERSLTNAVFEKSLSAEVSSIAAENIGVTLADGRVLAGGAIIIATGVRRRMLGVPGEIEFQGKGILGSGAKDPASARGKNVVIVGGGDAAIENTLILSKYAASVKVVHRRDEFSARESFMQQIPSLKNVELIRGAEVVSINGSESIRSIEIKDSLATTLILPADEILIRIGVVPNSELVRGVVELDNKGYVDVDNACRTSRSGIFAIGDVTGSLSPTISTAAGMGATAAKAIFAWLNHPGKL
jgi:thioredoxin reductase (NADPH)